MQRSEKELYSPTWAADAAAATPAIVTPAADGLSALIVAPLAVDPDPAKNVTTVKVSAFVDAALTQPLSDTVVVTVTQAPAAALGLAAGAPVDKNPPAAPAAEVDVTASAPAAGADATTEAPPPPAPAPTA